ncbi:MAG: hypothetical protein IPH44_18110 [Myxococcales bacterium]|nr:hypothetical protein [Myxococcales bacterium]
MISPPVATLSADHDPAIDDSAMERQASAAWAALGATPAGRQTRRAVAALLVALADVEGTAGGEGRS